MKNKNSDLFVRTWVEIDRRAIQKNYRTFRKVLRPKTKLMAVVKSNAYGHDMLEFSKELDRLGADFFGVDSITEAAVLQKNRIRKPILILGYTIPENIKMASDLGVSITVSSFDGLKALQKYRYPIKVHIKIDTGMHRQGFHPADAEKIVAMLKKSPHVSVEGVYTHFANADTPSSPKDTHKQAAEFKKATDVFEKAGFDFLTHAGATAGTLLFPEYHFDMVRIGIGLYGLWPSKEARKAAGKNISLAPVLSWKTVISEIKHVKKGERIGYNFTETFRKDAKVAVCPIGYWHGLPRMLSSVGEVLVHGKRARILGRVSMDMITIDVSGIPKVKVGDRVILIGKSGKDEVTAEEFADRAKTSNYEVVTCINPKIRRVIVHV